MSQSRTWSHQASFTADAQSSSLARDFVVTHLHRHGLAALAEDVRLVVSELASNATLHTATPFFTLTLTGDDREVTVSVDDSSPRFVPPAGLAEVTDVGGRGLTIAAAFSDDWGATVLPEGGKSVWASFAIQPGR